ncbi:phage tail tape measure protein [Bizionia sp.]|uniref:phage tail tape measure protein n=1 Tax=Bizionia sp. TaxID=1954480 RepID=UPI003A91F108
MAVRGDNSLYFSTGLDNSGLQQGANQAVNIISDLAGSIGKINPFAALGVAAITVFAGISAQAYSFAKDYESAMKEVQTISKATQEDFEGVSSAIFDLSKQTTDDPIKLAKAYYQIVSAGYDGAAGLKLLETASKAAVAGVTDTETAADGITTVLNAFKLEAEEAESVSDALFKTVELGKTTFSELSQNLSQAAPLAAATGVDFRELLAAVASLTKQGVPTAQAMTQIRAAIEATSEVMGDGWANAYTLQEAFQAVYDQAGGSQNELKNLTGRVEAVSAILATAGDSAEGAAKDLDQLSNSAGAASAAFGTQMTGNINQWTILGNRIRATTEDLGNNLLEASSAVAGFLLEITEGTDKVILSLEKERTELLLTQDSIIDVNTTQEDRIRLIDELKTKYPNYLANLKSDKASNDDVRDAIKGINDELLNRIVIQEELNSVDKAQERANEKRIDEAKAEKDLKLEVVKTAERYGVQLSDNNTLIERAKQLLGELPDDERLGVYGAGQRLRGLIGQLEGAGDRLSDADAKLEKMRKRLEEIKLTLGIDIESDGLTKSIEEQLKEIQNATKNDELIPYLKSQNEELKKAAEERLKYLKSLIEPTGGGGVKNRPNVSEVNAITNQKVNLEFDFTVDTTSINFIESVIRDLRSKFDAANENDRGQIKEYLNIWEEKLKIAREGQDDLTTLQEKANYQLRDLSLKRLREEKDNWKELLKLYKQGTDEYELIITQIDAISETTSDKIVETFSQVSGAIGEAKTLFEDLGASEDLTEALGMLQELGTAAGNLFSGNPGQMVQGGIQALNAVLSTGISSDTARFEKAIEDLERVIEKLDYTISKSVGEDRISGRITQIEQLQELEEAAEKAAEAEANARKEIKYLGITIANKGRGSGTDQAKLEELEETAESARREAEELRAQLDELYTGTTQTTIVDSIISGLKEGKKSVADFANDFKDLMQDAMLQAFQTKYLEKEIAKFYEQFSEAGSDSEYTPAEIASLRSLYNSIINGAQTDIEAINEVLEGLGLDGLGGQGTQKTGLTGAISTITEDTANILAGTLNAIRLDVASGISIATQNSQYLATISQGVTNYLPYLESIDGRMAGIESGLLQIQAQG